MRGERFVFEAFNGSTLVFKTRDYDRILRSGLNYLSGYGPELQSQFDDDGLLVLTDRFELLDGGIRYGRLFLHYHQLLRRGYSSNPNFDFLGTLARYRGGRNHENAFRIAIDHRRIMSFDDYQRIVEMDTWFGPKFDRAKLDDPSYVGLTVVGRSHPISLDAYPLVRTEFFWKANEAEFVKSLEIEELMSASKPYDNWHINRYVHAQRDMRAGTFRHLDGAAKIYAQTTYPGRFERKMPRHPRSDHYIKLFRIDGAIDLDDWLLLVSMFYKGNEMVIEYFDPTLFNEKIRPTRERMYQALNKQTGSQPIES